MLILIRSNAFDRFFQLLRFGYRFCSGLVIVFIASGSRIYILGAIRNSAVAGVAEPCKPQANSFDSVASQAFVCLRAIVSQSDLGRSEVNQVIPFLHSENNAERTYGISALGAMGYKDAIPQIEAELQSNDWRVVFAASRSLGWLGAMDAIPSLEKVALSHWLPEVRGEARQSVRVLHLSVKEQQEAARKGRVSANYPGDWMAVRPGVLRKLPSCPGNRWRWKRTAFRIGARRREEDDFYDSAASSLLVQDGELIGTNHGEWGGNLVWVPSKGAPRILLRDNVTGLAFSGKGSMFVFLDESIVSGDGAIAIFRRDASDKWNLSPLVQLPARADRWTNFGPDRLAMEFLAVESAGRVVVVSAETGILGLASCDAR
jgi:hypothetical protein